MVPDPVPAGQLPLVLWVTDPRQTEEQIRPVAARLAARGYEVITADFSKKPVSSALYRWKSVLNGGILPVEDYSMLLMQTIARYRSLLLLYGNSAVDSGRPVFIAGEGLGCEAVVAVVGCYAQTAPDDVMKIEGVRKIDVIKLENVIYDGIVDYTSQVLGK